ncbi:DUF5673 domain-containing protein [Clostridium niameyense]|uniref:DUF5673 domain-containing protein n=1 Tax=Clostridium niameyense TaxID=1622073 RepID=UPI00067F2340|nr:DUF5673 domain-containing protein [Clostridium niameyense]
MDILKFTLLMLVLFFFTLWAMLTFINLWYKTKIGGKVILNIKRGFERNIMILMGILVMVLATLSNNPSSYVEIIIAIVILYNGIEKFEIMENGIFVEGNFKKWEDIESCNWHEVLNNTLVIKGKSNTNSLRRFNTIKLKLKKEEQDEVFYMIKSNINHSLKYVSK